MNRASMPRHDRIDQRRLAELGCSPVQWRRPPALAPARLRHLVVISDDAVPRGLLADLLRGLSLAGHAAQVLPGPAATDTADTLTVHFGPVPTDAAHPGKSDPSALVLPSVSALRGNAAAKRAAWQALRAALR